LTATDPHSNAVHLDVFDGPLELLLFIVRRDGVDLIAVPIAPIADAFLARIELMEALDLEVAGEFIVMASTLCWLKSRELLPGRSSATESEDDDPAVVREQLTRRLLEYQRYQEAAAALGRLPMLGRDTFAPRPEPVEGHERPLVPGTDAIGLLQVFYGVLQKHTAPPPRHQITLEPRTLQEVAIWLLDRLRMGPRELNDLMSQLPAKTDKVLAFLAALELARLQMLDVTQSEHLAPIVLTSRTTPEEADMGRLSGALGA
jgi:segregation and condensation protein A